MSGKDPNFAALGQLGLDHLPQNIPGLGPNPGANFTIGQRNPNVTTRTVVNNITFGGNQPRSRSLSPAPTWQVTNADSEINIADNVNLTGKNIIAGAAYVRKGSRGRQTKEEGVEDHGDEPNYPNSNITINIGKGVIFNAEKVYLGASYIRIVDDITDEEIKRRFHELIGDKLDGKLNVGSGESEEIAKKQMKEAIRKVPGSILKICSSICLILWEDKIGTGFLAQIPGFEDVVLLTAGHNFTPGESFNDHVLYFKATDGDEKGKGVVKIPFQKIASRKFSLVSSCKGKRVIGNRKAGPAEECNMTNIHTRKTDGVNKDLDYCIITLPGWKTFIKDNKLDTLTVKEKVEDADSLFYVGHPYMGINTGEYIRDNADPDNNTHYAKLEFVSDGVYEWSNEEKESWKLYTTEEQDKLRVDEECPHYKSGYTEAQVVGQGGGILGPDKQTFIFDKPLKDEKEVKKDQALRFSYGSKKDVEEFRIKYTLDTKGGASGSPVLGDDYTVNAIHTFWSNKEKTSGGVKITAVMEDLCQLKEKYSSFFTNEPEEPFKIETEESWCEGRKLVDIHFDQKRIEELKTAKKEGFCVRLHLKPEEIHLSDANEKGEVKIII